MLGELEAYADLVTEGSYIVAMDGIMKDLTDFRGATPIGPWTTPRIGQGVPKSSTPSSCWIRPDGRSMRASSPPLRPIGPEHGCSGNEHRDFEKI